ncbi:MAG: hypothetical protein WC569_05445 [Candidatus Omnitrophota bacterium]
MNDKILRIMDANLNRTREGLRVCEDIARFLLSDKALAKEIKLMRHGATNAITRSNTGFDKLLRHRDVENDKSKFIDFRTARGKGPGGLFMSNMERVKESLRVLEECSKLLDEHMSRKYRKLRFRSYVIEKTAASKIGRVSGNR